MISIFIAIILLAICLFMIAKFDKINVKRIFLDQYDTMKNFENDKHSKYEIFVSFIIPFIIAGILIYFISATAEQINLILTIFSIFTGLLFNLLLLVFDISQKEIISASEIKKQVLKEIFYNISFSIFVSIILIILTLFCSINIEKLINKNLYFIVKKIASFLIYGLVGVFICSLFIILKRIHILLSKEFK